MRRTRWVTGSASAAVLLVATLGGDVLAGSSVQDPNPVAIIFDIASMRDSDTILVVAGPESVALAENLLAALPLTEPFVEPTYTLSGDESALVYDGSGERMLKRFGSSWKMSIDTAPLQRTLAEQKIDVFRVILCHPSVEVRFVAPRVRRDIYEECDFFGTSWSVRTGEMPFTIQIELVPHESRYRLFVGLVIGWFGLWTLIALIVGRVIRRDIPRAGGKPALIAVLLSLPGAGIAAAIVIVIGLLAGPADNLALARDLGESDWAVAGMWPASLAGIPVLALLVTLVWGRPWRRGPGLEARRLESLRPPSPPA